MVVQASIVTPRRCSMPPYCACPECVQYRESARDLAAAGGAVRMTQLEYHREWREGGVGQDPFLVALVRLRERRTVERAAFSPEQVRVGQAVHVQRDLKAVGRAIPKWTGHLHDLEAILKRERLARLYDVAHCLEVEYPGSSIAAAFRRDEPGLLLID